MKVLFTIPAIKGLTGPSIAALNIAKGLAKVGVKVYVVTSDPPLVYAAWLRRLREAGVTIHKARGFKSSYLYWLSLTLKALRVLLREGVDVVHTHTPKVCALIGFLGKAFGRKVVLTLEGDPLEELKNSGLKGRVFGKATWWLSRRMVDAICPCSRWLAKIVVNRFKDLKGKAVPVHNPVDFERFKRAKGGGVREELGVKGLMVLTPARLDPVKGLNVLIKAARKVVMHVPSTYFVIAGEGPLKEGLRRLAEELGVADKVIFAGFRGDVEKLTAACDVLVLPSIYEPFGMPVAEAGACRKPVIASDVGGLTEIVKHGVTGFTVPAGDHEAMAEALIKLLKDRGLRERMGYAGYRMVEESFTPEVIARKMLTVYANLKRPSRRY